MPPGGPGALGAEAGVAEARVGARAGARAGPGGPGMTGPERSGSHRPTEKAGAQARSGSPGSPGSPEGAVERAGNEETSERAGASEEEEGIAGEDPGAEEMDAGAEEESEVEEATEVALVENQAWKNTSLCATEKKPKNKITKYSSQMEPTRSSLSKMDLCSLRNTTYRKS